LEGKKLWQIWQITTIRQLFSPILLFYNMGRTQKRSCALIVLHKDRGKDIDIAVF